MFNNYGRVVSEFYSKMIKFDSYHKMLFIY